MGVPVSVQKKIARSIARGAASSVDEANQALRATSDTQRLNELERGVLIEYQQGANIADQAAPIRKKLSTDILQAQEEEREAARIAAISPDTRTANLDHQAVTPEEYSARMPQLRDEKYATDVVDKGDGSLNMPNPFDQTVTHDERYARWLKDQDRIYEVAETNVELRKWAMDDSPYTRKQFFGPKAHDPEGPMVFFRMDIRQDPRPNISPIQFDPDAREFGMHIGSRQAGMDIISPDVRMANGRKIKDLEASFKAIDADAQTLFQKSFKELRRNLFLRYGEQPFESRSAKILDEVIDEFFDILDVNTAGRNIEGMQNLTPENFKKRLRSVVMTAFDPKQHPVMTNVKKGLQVRDTGNNSALNIARDQFGRGTFNDDALQAIISAGDNAEQNVALRELLTENGYDHLVYINEGEDKGVLSLVLFNEENYQNVYKPSIGRKLGPTGHQAAAAAFLAPLASIFGLDDASTR